MRLDEYAEHDATALAELVASGAVEAAELAALAIAGCERVNGRLGAVVAADDDPAERARAAADGPFRGVPTMLKDLFHGDPGRLSEAGSRLAAGWVVQGETEFVRRLRACGLVPLGRTTTSEFGVMGTTETVAAGPTCSPWSDQHMAGGSSGGAAAAVGAGIVPVGSGTDGGGSIRIPASACGVVGLKPSRGRVSWAPLAGDPLLGWAVQFVLTRSVRDAAACLDVLAGGVAGDPAPLPAPQRPFAEAAAAEPGRLRIACCFQPWSADDPDDQVVAACRATAELLEGLGHELVEASPRFSWEAFLEAMTTVWSATTAQLVDGFAAAAGREPGPDTLELPTLRMVEHGRSVSGAQLLSAVDVAGGIGRVMAAFFAGHDLLLTPTLGALPARLGIYDPEQELEPRDLFSSWARLESFLPVFNATGQPAISLPLHMSEEGLPIGMQLVGRAGAEATLLSVGGQLEQALPWAGRVPPLHVSHAG